MALKEWLVDYSQQVIAGDIVACQKHKWACQRFLRDSEREGTEAFPYVFDEDKAARFLRWMTLFKHTQGVLEGKNIEPAPIQAFVFGNIYGWVHKDTGRRRFRYAYWQVARKNAKSQSLACVGSYEAMAFGVQKSKVYVGATKKEQSHEVFDEIHDQLKTSDDLKGKWRHRYGKIEHPKSGSFIMPLSKDEGKTGDGKNVQCAIIDEYHAHQNADILDVLVTGMMSRPEPIAIIITTAGYELSHPCYRVEYSYVSRLLDPNVDIENETYFAMVNELDPDDDVKNECVWEKANPILCSYPEGIASLRSEFEKAQDVPDKMRTFLTKNMNVWVDQRDHGYMPMSKWAVCGVPKTEFPNLDGRPCTIGFDLATTTDLVSVGFEFQLENGEVAVLSHAFIPEDKAAEKRKTDKMPYDLWIKQGWITETPGAVVDYDFIQKYIEEQVQEHRYVVREACGDPWNATQFMNNLAKAGYTTVEIRQGMQTLSGPTKNFRELVLQGKLKHDRNPVLTWAVSNAVTRRDANENIMLDKSKAADRIDPIAALINAHVRVMVANPPKKPSVYETRGVLAF